MFANRNGFYYTLDRTNGTRDRRQAVRADDVGEGDRRATAGRSCSPGHTPDEKGELTCPDITGGTNFWPPAYDPTSRLFFVNAREVCATYYAWKPEYTQGDRFTGGAAQRARDKRQPGLRRAARDRSGDRRAQVGVQIPAAVDAPGC